MNWGQLITFSVEDLSSEHKAALNSYQHEAHAIKHYQRTGEDQMPKGWLMERNEKIKAISENLNSGLSHIPKFSGKVYRNVLVPQDKLDSIMSNFKVGSVIHSDTVTSTGKDKDAIKTHANKMNSMMSNPHKINFHIKTKSGADVHSLPESKPDEWFAFKHSKEVLIPKHTPHRVVKVSRGKSSSNIHLEEIPHNENDKINPVRI